MRHSHETSAWSIHMKYLTGNFSPNNWGKCRNCEIKIEILLKLFKTFFYQKRCFSDCSLLQWQACIHLPPKTAFWVPISGRYRFEPPVLLPEPSYLQSFETIQILLKSESLLQISKKLASCTGPYKVVRRGYVWVLLLPIMVSNSRLFRGILLLSNRTFSGGMPGKFSGVVNE